MAFGFNLNGFGPKQNMPWDSAALTGIPSALGTDNPLSTTDTGGYDLTNIFGSASGRTPGDGINLGGVGGFTSAGLGSGGNDPNFLQRIGFLGDKNGAGWGGLALGAVQGGANIFMGMKQYGMAKDSLAQAKEMYDRNYAAQKMTTNSSMEDRQRARIASSPGAYVPVDQYMAQNGIK